jgi:DNA-directed RNA polymerase alpha subunit
MTALDDVIALIAKYGLEEVEDALLQAKGIENVKNVGKSDIKRQQIVDLRRQGHKFVDIARQFGMSSQAVISNYNAAERQERHNAWRLLSNPNDIERLNIGVRTFNALRRQGIKTVEDAKAVIQENRRYRNFGDTSFYELKSAIEEYEKANTAKQK